MKIISLIEDCTSMKYDCGYLFREIKDSLFINNTERKKLDIYLTIHKHNKNIFFSNNSILFKLINEDSFDELFSKKDCKIRIIKDDYFLCFKRVSRKEINFSLWKNHDYLCWSETDDRFIDVLYDKLILTPRFSNTKFEIRNYMNETLWHFTAPEGFRIDHPLQVVDNVLFFQCRKNVNEKVKTLGLDLETGDVVWEINEQIPYDNELIALLLNSDDNLCYGLCEGYFQILDPLKGEIVRHKNLPELIVNKIEPDVNREAIFEDKLWFISGVGSDTKFGAFDIKKHELIFVQDYPLEDDERFDTPVFHDSKLYLRGLFNNVLHVFE